MFRSSVRQMVVPGEDIVDIRDLKRSVVVALAAISN